MIYFCSTPTEEGQNNGPIETVPAMVLAPQDITQLVEEWRESHRIYSPLFQRREQREGAEKYLHVGWGYSTPVDRADGVGPGRGQCQCGADAAAVYQ
jgi:hypothetical protein